MAESYYSVYGWMPKELHISGNELHVFALIYCFTENCGQFSGSAQYIADQTGMAKRNVFRNLQKLTEKKAAPKTGRRTRGLLPGRTSQDSVAGRAVGQPLS